MKKTLVLLSLILLFSSAATQTLHSPNKKLSFRFSLTNQGEPFYQLMLGKREVIAPSKLGIIVKDGEPFTQHFSILNIDSSAVDQTWNPVWGEVKTIRDNHKELAITLQQNTSQKMMVIRFRLFDDGLGFRYEFPRQPNLNHFIVTDEITEFRLTGDHKAFWIPGDYDTNEYHYSTTRLSEINSLEVGNAEVEISTRTTLPDAVQTPLMLKSADGMYINIHEAALVNYPVMQLNVNKKTFALSSHLVPDAMGNKAYLQAPFNTPWRTVVVSTNAAEIVGSKLILNLNEPSTLTDVSWIKPTKYVGIWWEMHIGTSTWDYAGSQNATNWENLADSKPTGKHGATTENTKRYIDFAAKHGFDGVLVEGWNVGWEDWFGNWKENVFDFVTPYPDFNVNELQQYAAAKDVKLIMHHETSGSITNYERRIDDAFRFMKQHGYDAVKTGYVGRIIPRGEFHDGQWCVNHFNRVAEKAASYKIMVNSHESTRPTGMHRTYPNWIASEAARGNEFNAWSKGNPPDHETILPFTRLMGGPMDYTPGIFEIKMSYYNPESIYQVHTTLAKQLALYVTLYSPIQMAADLPENYQKHLNAFQFIKDVAVDWDDTRILQAEPGDYLAIARKAKNKNEWFIGAITDEEPRILYAPLAFLPANEWYVATIYSDAPNGHWKTNPMMYQIQSVLVNSKSNLKLTLAAGGGAAVSLKKATAEESKKIKKYR